MYKYAFLFLYLFVSSVWANDPIRPRANESVTGLFLKDEMYSVEKYFYREKLSRYEGGDDSYVLVNYPVHRSGGPFGWEERIEGDIPEYKLDLFGRSTDPWIHLQYQWQWWYSSLNTMHYNNVESVYFDTSDVQKPHIYPSFSEDPSFPGQCVAFAKIATQDTHGTSSWHAAKNVMERAWDFYNAYYGRWWHGWYRFYDPSSEHRGRMVAFFGENGRTGTRYPPYEDDIYDTSDNNEKGYGHVGIFLKYSYNEYGRPIGFWIADENYEGTPYRNNPDGRIRKHFILVNPIPNKYGQTYGHTYADNYFYVEIP